MSILMVDHYRRMYGEKNIEVLLAKKMKLNVVTVNNLRNYDMLAGIVFDNARKKHTRKVLLDSGLNQRERKFYLACLISKMVLTSSRNERAVVIGENTKLSKDTIAMTRYILGSEIDVEDLIEQHNRVVKPRQYIKIDMNVKAN